MCNNNFLKKGSKNLMAKPIMLTEEGYKKLEEELEFLKTEKRTEIAEKIKVARSYGDLSENSEYDDAKNEQAIMEARIVTIEATLKNAQIINENEISNEYVHLASKVTLELIASGKTVEYKIVGSNDTDPKNGKISDESPIGKAILGHKEGDVVEVETPSGIMGVKILTISK